MLSTHASFDIRHTQNFLKSRHLVERLLDRSSIGPQDLVVEIGPGKGRITASLAKRCRQLVAVEKDKRLAARLRRIFADKPHVAIVEADFLAFRLPSEPYKVFANVPFHITSAIVTKLTRGSQTPESGERCSRTLQGCVSPEANSWAPAVPRRRKACGYSGRGGRAPDDCYLIVQREAAERFCGVPRESLYAILLKPWFEPAIVHHFDRTDFDPPPHVDVVMLRLRKRGPPMLADHEGQRFRDFVVHSFVRSRPGRSGIRIGTLGAAGTRRLLAALGIDPHAGPTGIRFEQWLEIFCCFARTVDPHAWHVVAGAEHRLCQQQRRLFKPTRTRVVTKGGDRDTYWDTPETR